MDKYFCYDPADGFETYATAEEARKRAEIAIHEYRCEAHDGWHEEVDDVCWGVISEHTIITETIEKPKDCDGEGGCTGPRNYYTERCCKEEGHCDWLGDNDSYIDYGLVPVESHGENDG